MGSGEFIGKHLGKSGRDLSCGCEMVERALLIEARHLDGPFDRRTVAVDLKSVQSERDRYDAAVKRGRGAPVDRELLLARVLALIERRVVEVRQTDRPLDLQDAVAFQEHDGGMRVDALEVASRGVAEKCKHRLLAVATAALRRWRHGRNTAAPTSLPSLRRDKASLARSSGKIVV